MGWIWFFAQVFIFAPAGGALILSEVNKGDIGFCFVIVVCGVIIRMLAVFIASAKTDFDFKEKLLIAIGWCSKGSLPALLGSVVYAQALQLGPGYEQYLAYGNTIQTCSLFAILICLPASSMLLYTLAPLTLEKEEAVAPEPQTVKTESSRNLKVVEIIEFDEEQGFQREEKPIKVREEKTDIVTRGQRQLMKTGIELY